MSAADRPTSLKTAIDDLTYAVAGCHGLPSKWPTLLNAVIEAARDFPAGSGPQQDVERLTAALREIVGAGDGLQVDRLAYVRRVARDALAAASKSVELPSNHATTVLPSELMDFVAELGMPYDDPKNDYERGYDAAIRQVLEALRGAATGPAGDQP